MTRGQKLAFCLGGAVILLPLTAAIVLIAFRDRGVTVQVSNSGDTVLRNVVVVVTGDRVVIGELPAGRTGEALVHPTGESDVHIEVMTESGDQRKVTAGAYLERGNNGQVTVSIDNGHLVDVDLDL